MPISSSRNRLTVGSTHSAMADGERRSGTRSVPLCSVETPGARVAAPWKPSAHGAPTSGTPSPVPSGQDDRPKERVKLPLITRIQNTLFGRSRSHASSVDKSQGAPNRPRSPQPHRRRARPRRRSKPDSPEFALRKIRFFSSPPPSSPLTLCFAYPGVDLSHRDIIEAVRATRTVDVGDVESVQFVDMNVVLGAAGVNNRWLITVKDYDTRYLLLCDGLKIRGDYVIMRKYDDVNMEDYREYLRRKDTLASEEHRDAVQRLLAL